MLDSTQFNDDVCEAFEVALTQEKDTVLNALYELVEYLPDALKTGVLDDIEEYDVRGVVSERMEIVMRRALVLAQSYSIVAKI